MNTTYRNVLILGALFLLIEVFYSACRKDMDCRCPKLKTRELRISDVMVSNVDTSGNPFSVGKDYHIFEVKLELKIDETILSLKNCPKNELFFPSLYACDCKDYNNKRKKFISEIQIITHSQVWDLNTGDTLTNLDDYLKFYEQGTRYRTMYFYQNFLERNTLIPEANSYFIVFKLNKPASKEFDFEYIFHFSDGTSESYRPGLVKFY